MKMFMPTFQILRKIVQHITDDEQIQKHFCGYISI